MTKTMCFGLGVLVGVTAASAFQIINEKRNVRYYETAEDMRSEYDTTSDDIDVDDIVVSEALAPIETVGPHIITEDEYESVNYHDKLDLVYYTEDGVLADSFNNKFEISDTVGDLADKLVDDSVVYYIGNDNVSEDYAIQVVNGSYYVAINEGFIDEEGDVY